MHIQVGQSSMKIKQKIRSLVFVLHKMFQDFYQVLSDHSFTTVL